VQLSETVELVLMNS